MTQLNVVVLFAVMVVPGYAQAPAPAPADGAMTKVVALLQELKAKIEADGQEEQATYDKFACWCEETLARKSAAIESGKELIDTTQQEIIGLKGKIAQLDVSIKQLEKDIAANEEARKEADQIREKENEDYTAERTEAEQCIGAVESAIKVLSGAGTKKAMLETLQEAELLSVVAGVKGVLRRVPPSDALPESDLNLMKQFVADPNKFVAPRFSGAQVGAESTNPFGDYAPASTKIQGILKGMYDSFTANLETANAEEGEKRKAYEELWATSLQEHATLTATLQMKTKDHADATKQLAEDKVVLEEATVQLAADEKFFAETKDSCKTKAAEWAERTRLRTEELAGMTKALEILEGGMGTITAARSTLFIQVSDSKEDESRSAAYAKLKSMVKKHGGLRLAFLAAELQTGGHFDKIIRMIDKMITDLRAEEQEDIKSRDVCQLEKNKLKNQDEELQYQIDKKKDANKRLANQKTNVEGEIEAIGSEIEDTKKALKQALDDRNREEEDFKKAVKDDTDAIALLGAAIEALTSYYTNNKLPLALVQEPEYTVDPDKAPDASFSGGTKRTGESKGIIAILAMLKEDLENEIKIAQGEDAEAQAEYMKTKGELTNTLKAQTATENTLNGEAAELDGNIADTKAEIDDHEEMQDNTINAKEALKPNCQWIDDHFETRRDARKKEIEGLQEAKAILAGGAFIQEPRQETPAFLQHKK